MDGEQGPEVASGAAAGVTVTDMIRALADMRPAADSAGMIDQLRELEDWKSAAAALQARITVAFDMRQRRHQARAGVPAEEQGAGVAAQIALARREPARLPGYGVRDTRPAAPRIATPRSCIWTTSSLGTAAERRRRATAPDSAKLATTPRKPPGGPPTPARDPGTRSD